MFLQLGTYKFEGIKLPQSWNRSRETLYGQIAIIGSKPVVQNVGEKLEEIELGIFLSSEFCTPKSEMEALHSIRTRGVVSNLVDGTGKNYGKFVITSIQEDIVNALPDGYITDISATLRLLEYNTTESLVKQTGKAFVNSNPVATLPLTVIKTPMVLIVTSIKHGTDISKQISTQIAKGQMSAGKLNRLQQSAQSAIDNFNVATSKIDNARKMIQRGSTQVHMALNQATGTLTNIKILASRIQIATEQINSIPGAILGADSLQDYADLMNNGELLSSGVYALNIASTPFAAVIGSREGGI